MSVKRPAKTRRLGCILTRTSHLVYRALPAAVEHEAWGSGSLRLEPASVPAGAQCEEHVSGNGRSVR